MKTLMTLGCSLSDIQRNWGVRLAELLNVDKHVHYAFAGGGNQQLLDCISDYTLQNNLDDLTLVYQITSMGRKGGLWPKEYIKPHVLDPETEHSVDHGGSWQKFNSFFGEQIFLWAGNADVLENNVTKHNKLVMVSRTISTLCTLAKAGVDVTVFRGWAGGIQAEHWEKVLPVMKRYNLNVIEECYVEWCTNTDQRFADALHPGSEGAFAFAEQIIYPTLLK